MAYAENTDVPVEKTRQEIESLVRKAEAKKFISSWDESESIVLFVARERIIRFRVPMPTQADAEKTPAGKTRNIESYRKRWLEKETRRRWRSLLLCIKAKLESVTSGIETFDEAFLSHIVTDDKRTVYERLFSSEGKSSIKLLGPSHAESAST